MAAHLFRGLDMATTGFNVNRDDLEYILRSIMIAEAHSGGMTLTAAIQAAYGVDANDANLLPAGLRTVSGVYNNLFLGNETLGAADTPFPRITDPAFVTDAQGSIDFDGPSGALAVSQGDYSQPGNVIDSAPRLISNLIVNQTIDNQTIDNPATVAAWFASPLAVDAFHERRGADAIPVRPGQLTGDLLEVEIDNIDVANIPNQSADIGLSPGFNSWMTFFGQFFDHGLDLVTKADNGTVYIPLNPDDPLITHGPDGIPGTGDEVPPQLQFMAVTRAKVDANGNVENTTTPFIDQNQTYTSHPSHHVFLREYVMGDAIDGMGLRPLATGHLLDGQQPGTIATWADIKAQSLTKLGIQLNDFDVHNAPLLVTDEYANSCAARTAFR
jgi:hypothetical protein